MSWTFAAISLILHPLIFGAIIYLCVSKLFQIVLAQRSSIAMHMKPSNGIAIDLHRIKSASHSPVHSHVDRETSSVPASPKSTSQKLRESIKIKKQESIIIASHLSEKQIEMLNTITKLSVLLFTMLIIFGVLGIIVLLRIFNQLYFGTMCFASWATFVCMWFSFSFANKYYMFCCKYCHHCCQQLCVKITVLKQMC